MKGTGKMKRLLAMLLCVMQLFGCIPHLDAHGEVQTHTHAHAEECAHQVDDSNAWWSYELAEGSNWTANDDGKTHSALAYAVYESNCALCGKYFVVSREETPQVYDDYHDYNSEGVCYACGYENTCEHPEEYFNSWFYFSLADGAQWTANDDGKKHSALAYKITRGRCDLCKMYFDISRDETPHVYTEEHYYEDGVCQSCGAENSCEHPESYISTWYGYELDAGEKWTANKDGKTHSAKAIKRVGIFCELCGMDLEVTEDESPVLYTVEHDYFNSNICDDCGYENSCEHPIAYLNIWTDYELVDDIEWTINDDGTHTGNCYEFTVTNCNLCGQYTRTRGEAKVRTLPHEFYRNICQYCGVLNSCTHPNATTYTQVEYHTDLAADNGLTHTGIGTLYESGWCADCQSNLNKTVLDNNYSLTEQHYMTNGICDVCGYKTLCDHPTTDVFGSFRNGRNYTQKDEIYHTGVYDYYETTYCTVCESNLTTQFVEANKTHDSMHIFRDDGTCFNCGYLNTCTHDGEPATYTAYYDYSSNVTFTEATHSYTATKYYELYCDVCGTVLEYTETPNTTVTEEHKFNTSGVCIICGYGSDSVCTHENAEHTGGNQKNQTVVINDNGTHTRTFDVYWEYTCPDCFESFETFIEQGSETEPHVAGGNPNVCVICGSDMCERHYYRDGKCIECGYENDCTHANAVFAEDGRQKNTVTVNNGNGTHTRTFDVYHFYDCPDCEEAYAIFTGAGSETEAHVAGGNPNVCVICGSGMCERHYYRDGKCIECGYENDCTHANAVFAEDGRNKNTVFTDINNDTHTRTFDVYHFYDCPDCEEAYAIFMDQGSETEAHEYPNGVNCQCGKLKPCETHDWSNLDGVCSVCGNNCTHPQDGLIYSTYYELADGAEWIADENGTTHTAMAVKVVRKYCSNCYLETEDYRDETAQLYSVDHSFLSDGYCYHCGYECPHENKTQTGGDQQSMVIGDIGNGEHIRAFDVYWIYHCPDCNATIEQYIERGYEIEPHTYFGDGEHCDTCGAAQNCSHIRSEYYLDYEMFPEDPQPHNEEFHLNPYTTYLRYLCAACNGSFMHISRMENLEGHQFGADGFCACGAQGEPMTCQHENIDFRYCEENVVYTDITDQQHTKTYDLYFYTWCPDCETRRVYYLEAPNQTTTEDHDFSNGACACGYLPTIPDCERHYYLDGMCIECGHENLCAHTNAVFAEDGRQKNTVTVNNGNGTHTRTFDVYHFYDCPDCEESYAIFTGQGSETEAHVSGGNPNVCVICGSDMCERHYYRDGKCIECGYENDCTHANAVFAEDGRQKNTVFTDINNNTHTRTFDVYHFYDCPDCEESYAIFTGQGSETEDHEYPNGVNCRCGKLKPCDAHNFVSGECTACGHLVLEGMEHVIVLPSALKTIEKEAFAGSSADAFVVPDGCTTIGSRAFAQCDSLKCIILPGSATQIADDAFDGCEGVTILAPQGSAAHALAGELNFTWHNAQ